ncbi:MAG: DUF2336 domain-containing protein [Pseudomonadota bacterium]|jgi:uncharacterized protein (DUF2336 family)
MPLSKLEQLIDLAKEPSSARRRELLREITDLFMAAPETHNEREMELFDGVMSKLASEMEEEVRCELSHRIADTAHAPHGLVQGLAADTIHVAAPLLTHSPALSDEDLLRVVRTKGQEHLRAVSQRSSVSEAVTDVIVERADDNTLNTLLRNDSATLSRRSAETAVDRAVQNPDLHEAVVDRHNLPVDLLNEMYFIVEQKLRERIMAKNADLDPDELERALETGRKRLAARDGALPPDYAEAEAFVRNLRSKGPITAPQLVGFLRAGERTRFLVALAELAEVDFYTAKRIVDRQELDALAIVCKAANFDRTLFLTFAVLILPKGDGMGKAQQYGQLYLELPRETAQRTLRFWRMRRASGELAA